ncbi:hypothetical protein CBS101457_001179 [Exobasidium rhododendri]|nr:hypothetical protein CBS101457_001179 [Exobasidium rhododendri]
MDASSSAASSAAAPSVVIRCGHIIPSIRLTPPDSRPAMAPSLPEQDLGPNSLYVPLRTEEVGWEEGGLIWAPKRYCYPTVHLYGGLDDHVIGTYRGGPKGYRFINITDSAFSVASSESEECSSAKKSKTSKDGKKSSMPQGAATKRQDTVEEAVADEKKHAEEPQPATVELELEAAQGASTPSSSHASTPYSSRRGSSSTDDGESSGADTGMTTPADDTRNASEAQEDLVQKLDAALLALHPNDGEDNRESKKTKLAKRAGAVEICNETVNASQLAGPQKSKLQQNSLGLGRSLTLSDSVPSMHFQSPKGRSSSRRSIDDSEYNAGWTYEQNMQLDFSRC